MRDIRLKMECRSAVFHGPNYFLPECADCGVATIHDLSIFRYPETHPIERIKQFEKLFHSTLQRAQHLITDTEAIRQEVIAMFSWPADRITAVHLGVADSFRPLSPEGAGQVLGQYGLSHGAYCLCVSTIEPRKKIDALLGVYARLPVEMRRYYPLILVGSVGWKSEEVHRQIEQACAEGWLKYYGFVPEQDLPVLYAGARLFIYPSSYEGFGLPVLEAMASGVPVVTSNSSSLPEVAGGAALLIDPDDVDMLADNVHRGLTDEVWRATASSHGLAVAGRFTWNRCVEETVKVYGRLC